MKNIFPIVSVFYTLLGVMIGLHAFYGREKNRRSALVSAILLIVCGMVLIYFKEYWLAIALIIPIFIPIILALIFVGKIICKMVPFSMLGKRKARNEILRKAFHGIVFLLFLPHYVLKPLCYTGVSYLNNFLPKPLELHEVNFLKEVLILIAGGLIPVFLLIEYLRIYGKKGVFPNNILRGTEEGSLAAYFYTGVSIFFISLIFPQTIILASITMSLLGDAAAAIVGTSYGKIRIYGDKTVEGCLAGFLVASISGLFFISPISALLTAVIIEIVDVLNKWNINDNLLFPVTSATTIWYIEYILLGA